MNATAHLRDEMRQARFTGTVADLREEGRGWRQTEATIMLLTAFYSFHNDVKLDSPPFTLGAMDARMKKEIRRIPGSNPVSLLLILHYENLNCHAAATEPMGLPFRRDGHQG